MYRARFLALLAAGSLLAACGSSSSGPNDSNGDLYLRFKANGTQVEYTTQSSLLAAFSQVSTQYGALLTGFDANSSASLQIYDGVAVTAKTYQGYDVVGAALSGVLLTYRDPSSTVYVSGGNGVTDAVITISEMTATNVKGTFHGTLHSAGKADISVTNGEFFLKRAN